MADTTVTSPSTSSSPSVSRSGSAVPAGQYVREMNIVSVRQDGGAANLGQATGGDAGGKTLLRRCGNYAEAQKVVDTLSDRGFEVEHTAIAARGLAIVEQVTGRLNWSKALLQGLASGAGTGFLIGAILGLFIIGPPAAWLSLLLYSTLVGAVIGGILRVVGYLATGGKRDFSSMGGLTADRFDVMVDPGYKDKAEELLGST